MQPIIRPAARVILIDASQQVLLMQTVARTYRSSGRRRVEASSRAKRRSRPHYASLVRKLDCVTPSSAPASGCESTFSPGKAPSTTFENVSLSAVSMPTKSARTSTRTKSSANGSSATAGGRSTKSRRRKKYSCRALSPTCSHPCSGVNTLMSLLKSESE